MTVAFRALGTTAVIVTEDATREGAAREAVELELDAIDRACSRFRPDSELAFVNRAGGAPVTVSPLLLEALHVALDAARSSGGLATSSTTVRRWRSGTVELHHLVDPRTGRPAESPWRTVSVAAGSCVDANVASTASFLLDDAPAWLESRGLPARLVRIDGETTVVAGWPEDSA